MEENFYFFVWNRFKKIGGLLVTAIALLAAFLLWEFDTKYNFSAIWVIPIFILLLLVLITLIDVAYETFKRTKNLLPKVLFGRRYGKDVLNEAMCLLEPSSLFYQDSSVSCFIIDDHGFELLIAVGFVITIQQNKNIQIKLDKVAPGYEDKILEIINNNGDTLKNLIVKPGIPNSFKIN